MLTATTLNSWLPVLSPVIVIWVGQTVRTLTQFPDAVSRYTRYRRPSPADGQLSRTPPLLVCAVMPEG